MSEVQQGETLPKENMWNKGYQKARHELKKRGDQVPSCCNLIVQRFFKHLVHIFVIVFALSFMVMIVVIVESQNASENLDSAWNNAGFEKIQKYM